MHENFTKRFCITYFDKKKNSNCSLLLLVFLSVSGFYLFTDCTSRCLLLFKTCKLTFRLSFHEIFYKRNYQAYWPEKNLLLKVSRKKRKPPSNDSRKRFRLHWNFYYLLKLVYFLRFFSHTQLSLNQITYQICTN